MREFTLVAAPTERTLLDGRSLAVWAYNGQVPGPVLRVRRGDTLRVRFTNRLPQPTTIHWHGLRIPDVQDGNPMVVPPIPAGGSHTYEFVVPDAGTYWYHPHANTIEQIERGLYGAIVVHEAEPPRFTTERVLVLDDVRLDASYQVARFATAGQRYDLEVTFDGEGEAARLVSDVLAAAPGGGTRVVPRTVAEVLNANETVVIETRFENPGRWMYHCHIPEHAEAGMMAELEVTPRP